MSFSSVLVRTPVNSYEFGNIVAEQHPELFMDFERSPSAAILNRVEGDSNAIVSRSFSSRVWAGAWAGDHDRMDAAIPAAEKNERASDALARLDAGLSSLYSDHFELFGVAEYRPYLAGSGYSLVTEMQAVIRSALFRPELETLAALGGPKQRVRVLREVTDSIPLHVVIAILPTVNKLAGRSAGAQKETIFRNARILEVAGVPLTESARLLSRYPYDKVHELYEKVGIPFDYLDALDG